MPNAPIAAAIVIFALMALETLVSRRHERDLRARGAVEPSNDVHRWMAIAYPGGFMAIVLDGASRGSPAPWVLVTGAAVFALAKALKYWAVRTLGDRWSFRVLVLPGAPLIGRGPYRFVRHPNYVAVIGEFVGATLVCGAWLAGPISTLIFLLLIRRRIRVEEAALAHWARP